MSHFIEVACPVEDCEAEIRMELDYEPADNHYGMDRDGNRGMRIPGYWFVADSVPASCSSGHVFTEADRTAIGKDAEECASDYEAVSDYDGPDRWDEL